MPTRCSTVVLNTNDDTVQALDVPPFIIGAWEVITVLVESSQIMVLRPSITLSLEGKMHTRHSLKCPGLVGHANKEPYSRGWQLRTALGPWDLCLSLGNIELTRVGDGWKEKELQYCILELVEDSDRSAQGISFSELVGSLDVKMVEFLLGLVGTSDMNHTESITSFVKERMEGKLEGENDVSDTQLVIDKRITFYFEENISIGDSMFLQKGASQILELLPKPISKWQDAGPDHIYILGVFHAEPQSFFSNQIIWMNGMDRSIYYPWFDPVLSSLPSRVCYDWLIYLRVTLEICPKKMMLQRRIEGRDITWQYRQGLYGKHDSWFCDDLRDQEPYIEGDQIHPSIQDLKSCSCAEQ
uniref:Uncharacterized protein n=1 Tax=Oryza glumipatula TaxID=40148 RepID=A0A0D9ZZH5_9ORYZ